MAPKSSTTDEVRSPLRDFLDRGEEVVSVFLEELTGSSSLREELGKTVRRATQARKTVDKNLEAVLGALNLPTRRDYKRLVEEVHAVQGAIVNLNMKIDRLLALQTAARPPVAPGPVLAPTTHRAAAPAKPTRRPAAKSTGRRRRSA